MAEDAFALSPISARASPPSEADYGAIRDAFMETARGRWFLDEFARRNRNADTGMVLDAVARIEAGLAARGEASSSPASIVALIRPLIDEARATSAAAMTTPQAQETIAAGRRASRIIREISWSLRETGTDPRICNIFDAQLLAIERVNDLAADETARERIGEAFDDLVLRLEEISGGGRPAQRETAPEPVETVGANLDAAEAAPVEPQTAVAALPTDEASAEDDPSEAERAADDAMLDMVAIEMAAPDIDDTDDFDSDDDALAELQSLAASTPPPALAMPVSTTAALTSSDAPAAAPSLGAALIANGIVRTRAPSHALAPFQRMSQIEKIAFFS